MNRYDPHQTHSFGSRRVFRQGLIGAGGKIYDLQRDPGEVDKLWNAGGSKALQAQMMQMLQAQMMQILTHRRI